jgi:hypothetical protein
MKLNVGSVDRIIRVVVAVAGAAGAYAVGFASPIGIVLLVVATIYGRHGRDRLLPAVPTLRDEHLPGATHLNTRLRPRPLPLLC